MTFSGECVCSNGYNPQLPPKHDYHFFTGDAAHRYAGQEARRRPGPGQEKIIAHGARGLIRETAQSHAGLTLQQDSAL